VVASKSGDASFNRSTTSLSFHPIIFISFKIIRLDVGQSFQCAYCIRMVVLPTGMGTHGYPTLLDKGIEFYPRVNVCV
jgi:hypothetical protein